VHKTEIAILGAGASGLFFARHLKKDYILIDQNEIPQKIKVSGGGKCNFTNEKVSSKNYLGDSEFVNKILNYYTNKDVLKFFRDINYQKIKNNQYFASSSDEIIKKLNQKKFIANIKKIEKKDNFLIYTSKGIIEAKKVVVATGGISFSSLGASDIGYKIAESFGHKIVTPKPALVGLTLQKDDFWMKSLSGVSLLAKVEIPIYQGKKIVDKKVFKDNILFSHRGITGPVILNTSLYWQKGSIKIDFLPNVKVQKTNKSPSNMLKPKRFITEFLKSQNIQDTPKNLDLIVERLKNYTLSPAGTFGFSKAEVTKGGVDIDELNDFESKFCKDLYFIGEVVDVTGELGGYNFQWCFSSAKFLADRINNG
jgi:predicted Rossmann fold flavoprotein